MIKNFVDIMLLDAILRMKKIDQEWKGTFIFLWSFLGAINLFSIGFWLKYYFQILPIPTLKINLFPPNIYLISMLNYVPGFCVLYGFPAFIIIYFLVFYKGRYLKLMRKYPNIKGNKYYQAVYIIGTAIFAISSPLIVYAIKGPII